MIRDSREIVQGYNLEKLIEIIEKFHCEYLRMSRPFDSALNRLLESVHCDEAMKVNIRLVLNDY